MFEQLKMNNIREAEKLTSEYWSLKPESLDKACSTINALSSDNYFLTTRSSASTGKSHIQLHHLIDQGDGSSIIGDLKTISMNSASVISAAAVYQKGNIADGNVVFTTGHDDGRLNVFELNIYDENKTSGTDSTKLVQHYNQGKQFLDPKAKSFDTKAKAKTKILQVDYWDVCNNANFISLVENQGIVINDLLSKKPFCLKSFANSNVQSFDINPTEATLLGLSSHTQGVFLLDLRGNEFFQPVKSCMQDQGTSTSFLSKCCWVNSYEIASTSVSRPNEIDIWDIRHSASSVSTLKHESRDVSIADIQVDRTHNLLYSSDTAGSIVSWDLSFQSLALNNTVSGVYSSEVPELKEFFAHKVGLVNSCADVYSTACGNYIVKGTRVETTKFSLLGIEKFMVSLNSSELGYHRLHHSQRSAATENILNGEKAVTLPHISTVSSVKNSSVSEMDLAYGREVSSSSGSVYSAHEK